MTEAAFPCGHVRDYSNAGDQCRYCGTKMTAPKDDSAAFRQMAMTEIWEAVVTLDRRYARMPKPPWSG